jgi:hypothetical protein
VRNQYLRQREKAIMSEERRARCGPIESGYYDTDLQLIDGQWKITGHQVLLDMPVAFPGA